MTELGVEPRAWQRNVVVVLIAVSLAVGAIGNALTPLLLRESPAALLALHASYPQMGLASARLDPTTFVLVAGVRRWLGEAVYFFGGRVLGTQLLAWYARRRGKELRLPDWLNHRYWWVRDAVIVFLPHPVIAAFFGAVGVPWPRYMVLKLVGSVLTVIGIWYLAAVVQVPLEIVADFVEANAVAITAIGLLLAALWWRWRKRGSRLSEAGGSA